MFWNESGVSQEDLVRGLGTAAVILQLTSLAGVWFEVFGKESREGHPPLTKTSLVLAVLSGSAYFLSGVSETQIDYTKVAIGAASVLTCGTNLAQHFMRLSTLAGISVIVAAECALLGLTTSVAGLLTPHTKACLVIVLPFCFGTTQFIGRASQIIKFSRFGPKGASLLLWGSNVLLNVVLVTYHNQRGELVWTIANSINGLLGLAILGQITFYKIRGKTPCIVLPSVEPVRRVHG